MKSREPRTHIIVPVRIRWGGEWVRATTRNISSRGMMLSAPIVPPPGTYVEVQMLTSTLTARAVWSDGRCCGLQAREKLNVIAIAEARQRQGQAASLVSGDGARPPASAFRAPREAGFDASRSRQSSTILQFLTAIAVATTAAGSLGWEVYHALAAPLAAANAKLSGPASGPTETR
jgi:hypothetical protein